MIKALILDDDIVNCNALKGIVYKIFPEDFSTILTAHTIKEAKKIIDEQAIELIFLDIGLNGETGFDIINLFPSPHFSIIFTTAFAQYALEAIKASCIDYLLKPIQPEALTHAITKYLTHKKSSSYQKQLELLVENLQKKQFHKITIPTSDGYYFINIDDIIYCEANDNYTHFYTLQEKVIASKTLKEYEELLQSNHHFFRCHKTFLINLRHIKKMSKKENLQVLMTNGYWIDVSVRKKEEFLQKIQEL